MELQIEIEESAENGVSVVLKGSLDTTTSMQLDARIANLLAAKPRAILIDMGGLDYISSSGIRVVLKTRKTLSSAADLLLVNLQPRVKAVFDIINALPDQIFFESMQDAQAYLER